jgi:acyl transferase domain-containing protein
VTPAAVLGHSLGEVAAAICAGAMDVETGLALAAHRGRLMQSTARGAMLAIAAPLSRVTEEIRGTGIDIAAINGPSSIVVSGDSAALAALTARLSDAAIKWRPLVVSIASHSRLMDPVLPALHRAIAHLPFGAPRLPIVSTLTGRLATHDDLDAAHWCRHVREPVRFHQAAQALRAQHIDVCVEIGPDAALVNLVTAAGLFPERALPSLCRGVGERASILAAVDALHQLGHQLAWSKVLAASNRPRGAAPFAHAGAHRSGLHSASHHGASHHSTSHHGTRHRDAATASAIALATSRLGERSALHTSRHRHSTTSVTTSRTSEKRVA